VSGWVPVRPSGPSVVRPFVRPSVVRPSVRRPAPSSSSVSVRPCPSVRHPSSAFVVVRRRRPPVVRRRRRRPSSSVVVRRRPSSVVGGGAPWPAYLYIRGLTVGRKVRKFLERGLCKIIEDKGCAKACQRPGKIVLDRKKTSTANIKRTFVPVCFRLARKSLNVWGCSKIE
jgi:hypothetical protein